MGWRCTRIAVRRGTGISPVASGIRSEKPGLTIPFGSGRVREGRNMMDWKTNVLLFVLVLFGSVVPVSAQSEAANDCGSLDYHRCRRRPSRRDPFDEGRQPKSTREDRREPSRGSKPSSGRTSKGSRGRLTRSTSSCETPRRKQLGSDDRLRVARIDPGTVRVRPRVSATGRARTTVKRRRALPGAGDPKAKIPPLNGSERVSDVQGSQIGI